MKILSDLVLITKDSVQQLIQRPPYIGRLSRGEYLFSVLLLLLTSSFIFFVLGKVGVTNIFIFSVIQLITLVLRVFLGVRRSHDLGHRSSFYTKTLYPLLLCFIVFGIFTLVVRSNMGILFGESGTGGFLTGFIIEILGLLLLSFVLFFLAFSICLFFVRSRKSDRYGDIPEDKFIKKHPLGGCPVNPSTCCLDFSVKQKNLFK